MKNNDLNILLERYRNGSLDEAGLAELNRMSGRDEVTAAADAEARRVVRRRWRMGAGLAVVALLVSGVVVLNLTDRGAVGMPEVAEAVVPQTIVEPPAAMPVVQPEVEVQRSTVVKPEKAVQHRVADKHIETVQEPVVVCNNQCEADSVISEIRRFLAV